VNALVVGAALGTGILLVVSGLVGTRPSLRVLLAHVDQLQASCPIAPSRTMAGRLVGTYLATTTAGAQLSERLRVELRMSGSSPAELLGAMVTGAAIGLAAVPIIASTLTAGMVRADPGLLAITTLGTICVGAVVPVVTLRRQAQTRRRAFRHALSCYLDLVAIRLAGGAGIDTALNASVDAGHGWAFSALRDTLRAARLAGQPPWDGFARLGDDLDVTELRELAASMTLAGSEGARVRASLLTKARAMRTRALSDTERHAQAASERMALPIVVLMTGFVVFLGYPAVVHVVHGI
jgi:tight adherence protein C